jgi:hypothetical protein
MNMIAFVQTSFQLRKLFVFYQDKTEEKNVESRQQRVTRGKVEHPCLSNALSATGRSI